MKQIIITGSSSGLGKSLSQICIDEGNIVHMLERNKKKNKRNEFYYFVDLMYPEDSFHVIGEVLSNISNSNRNFSEIVFINCASTISPITFIKNLHYNEIDASIKINIQSPINIIMELLKYCDRTKCGMKIINITSGVAKNPIEGWSCYSMCKAAIVNFLNTLEKENNLIKIVSIDPGVMDTNMQCTIRNSSEENFPQLQKFITYKNSKTLRMPQEVAKIIYDVYIKNWYAKESFENLKRYIDD